MRVIDHDDERAVGGDHGICARAILVTTLVLVASGSVVACECADRPTHDEPEPTGSTSLESTSTEGASATTSGSSTTSATEGPVDASRFMGIFHNEHWLTPFGEDSDIVGGTSIANLEIRPDGTATMIRERCGDLTETQTYAYRWEARPGPVLEFFAGPDEESLRYFAATDLESLRAIPIDECGFQFEVDGALDTTETYRAGRACWVNRCESPPWRIHIDYCEGEEPPSCE